MTPHVHVGALELLIFALMYLVLGFALRQIQTRYPDSPFGKAVAYIHG